MPNLDNLKKSERTKETILQHALFLFERDGYDFVTMRELAKACEFSLGSFYYHFRNKEEIVLELFKSSLAGHLERSHAYLDSRQPKLESAMTWICLDRFQEFETHRALLRVLVQKLDPQDPISPWHKSALSIRQQSVALFDKLVARSITNLDAKTRRQLARALWLQHLLILGIWSFDRTPNEEETNAIMRQSIRLWKNLPTLVNVPGMKTLFNLVLSPLERFEGKP